MGTYSMSNEMHPPPIPKKKGDWFSRNWKWFIPLCVIGGAVFLLSGIAVLFGFAMKLIKSSEPYQESMALVRNNSAIIELIGEPIDEGLFVQGKFQSGDNTGIADFAIPIHGPKGEGHVYVYAEKREGIWEYEVLSFVGKETEIAIEIFEGEEAQAEAAPR